MNHFRISCVKIACFEDKKRYFYALIKFNGKTIRNLKSEQTHYP